MKLAETIQAITDQAYREAEDKPLPERAIAYESALTQINQALELHYHEQEQQRAERRQKRRQRHRPSW